MIKYTYLFSINSSFFYSSCSFSSSSSVSSSSSSLLSLPTSSFYWIFYLLEHPLLWNRRTVSKECSSWHSYKIEFGNVAICSRTWYFWAQAGAGLQLDGSFFNVFNVLTFLWQDPPPIPHREDLFEEDQLSNYPHQSLKISPFDVKFYDEISGWQGF